MPSKLNYTRGHFLLSKELERNEDDAIYQELPKGSVIINIIQIKLYYKLMIASGV